MKKTRLAKLTNFMKKSNNNFVISIHGHDGLNMVKMALKRNGISDIDLIDCDLVSNFKELAFSKELGKQLQKFYVVSSSANNEIWKRKHISCKILYFKHHYPIEVFKYKVVGKEVKYKYAINVE